MIPIRMYVAILQKIMEAKSYLLIRFNGCFPPPYEMTQLQHSLMFIWRARVDTLVLLIPILSFTN